ncbi:tyrosine-type recombinase/integrase [Sphingomonas lutea]|uniref:Tyrosine-type recombinase/integrase n=1 Tax=Sphingomonas lutea TaxID=1045317 RepID=A0A7G9SK58_9SPHN|nr:site-specific integrase [Sphingomonas lutea]QNN68233.1 tyrosine-type recombinase/integrase [Sphingomonas lutea]
MTKAVVLTDSKVASIKPPARGQKEHPDLKVTGLRLRIGVSGKKVWIIRARAGNKMINKKVGVYPTMGLGAARTAAERLLKTIARDGGTEALERTFGAVAELWLDKLRASGKRQTYIHDAKRKLELHVLPKWQDRKVTDLRRSEVRDLIEGIEGAVLPNRVLATIRPIFRLALSRDWIDVNPAEGLTKPKGEEPRDRVLDMGEAKRIWTAAGLLGFPGGPFVRALLLTAQRRSEVASMRWSNVDLNAGTWRLKAADTKAGRAHLVPLSAPMIELLKALPRLDDSDYVFTTDGQTGIAGFSKFKSRLDRYIAADECASIEGWRLHDLRRTAATNMVRLGVLEEVVGKVLNHASAGVTAKVYALHRYEPEKRSALDRWGAELMRAVGGQDSSNVVAFR